jgi:non-specific serine/threonine protein kinase
MPGAYFPALVASVYRFGSFELQPTERRLLADGRPAALGPRAFDVLVTLIERAGNLVTKDQLLQRVWPNLVVEENNLQVQVSALRKILGQDAIATVPGRGYRFSLEVLADERPSAPATAGDHNLPRPLTTFIGHEDDLDEYATVLGKTRLLTLTGIGGCGKTRLALELAHRVLPTFPDGLRYIDFGPLLDAERLHPTVAAGLGIREDKARPIEEAICSHLGERSMLLVLDNCEHLAEACAALIRRVIGAAPLVRILATSREGLGIPGEAAVTVRSLSFPARGAEAVGALLSTESVRLFVDRAQSSLPAFDLTMQNAPAVAEICRRLDGIPLAIELAAARVKLLSVEEIRSRLDDRFRLLIGGGRAAIARQQTLLAAIRWSYDHLTPDDQSVLRRLSVFVGGCTLDGAIRVAGASADEYAMLDALERLAGLSLITIQRLPGQPTRYSMLESVRQYALERVVDGGEESSARDAHLQYYVSLAEKAGPELRTSHQAIWFGRLDAERENITLAFEHCRAAPEGGSAALEMTRKLVPWFMWDHPELWHRVTREAVAHPGAQQEDAARSAGLGAAAFIASCAGRYAEAASLAETSVRIARACGDDPLLARVLWSLGTARSNRGDLAAARACFTEAIPLARRCGNHWILKDCLTSLGEMDSCEGHFEIANEAYHEALAIGRELENPESTWVSHGNLARNFVSLRDQPSAIAHLRESVAAQRPQIRPAARPPLLALCAGLAALREEWALALRLSGACASSAERCGAPIAGPDLPFHERVLESARAALAAKDADRAFEEGRSLDDDTALAQALGWLDTLPEG